jgi:bifunctional non-homologous end joining protein LigD
MPRVLSEYRRKRHFNRTAEPAGKAHARSRSHWKFVVQKHAARWLHYDFRLEHDGVVLRTRKQNDWTSRFPEIAEALGAFPVRQAVLDGEVVAQTAAGISNFQALQVALGERKTGDLIYYVFDLPYLDGFDLREAPLIERKRRLSELLESAAGRIRLSEHFEGSGAEVLAKSCEMKLEGIVSKRRDSGYIGGRRKIRLKTKCVHREEFVIGGFTDSSASRRGLGAILVGYFNPAGDLVYAGKVGTGFSARSPAPRSRRRWPGRK